MNYSELCEEDKYQLDDSQFANDKEQVMLSGFYRYCMSFIDTLCT